ncbi:MAG: hypothetical protein K6E19_01525, partial [Lachnospiraceae bacterium]|nr:hypothetical protein [Lachnospiraceae bacterium]
MKAGGLEFGDYNDPEYGVGTLYKCVSGGSANHIVVQSDIEYGGIGTTATQGKAWNKGFYINDPVDTTRKNVKVYGKMPEAYWKPLSNGDYQKKALDDVQYTKVVNGRSEWNIKKDKDGVELYEYIAGKNYFISTTPDDSHLHVNEQVWLRIGNDENYYTTYDVHSNANLVTYDKELYKVATDGNALSKLEAKYNWYYFDMYADDGYHIKNGHAYKIYDKASDACNVDTTRFTDDGVCWRSVIVTKADAEENYWVPADGYVYDGTNFYERVDNNNWRRILNTNFAKI